jgi:hypothetical protein
MSAIVSFMGTPVVDGCIVKQKKVAGISKNP